MTPEEVLLQLIADIRGVAPEVWNVYLLEVQLDAIVGLFISFVALILMFSTRQQAIEASRKKDADILTIDMVSLGFYFLWGSIIVFEFVPSIRELVNPTYYAIQKLQEMLG